MAVFRFRAAVALDLRRAAESKALGVRAGAEARFHEAHRALEATQLSREQAQRQLTDVQRVGSDVETILWHRNWIVRLAASVIERRRELEARALDVRAADVAWREARRRRLALERLRERAFRRFLDDERRAEMKAMDELARIRYVMPDIARSES